MLTTSISSTLAGKSHEPPPRRARLPSVLAVMLLGALGGGCGSPPPVVDAPAGVRLERVSGWHHEGEALTVAFTAELARLEPESDHAQLEVAALRLPTHQTELTAPAVTLDLHRRRARGEGGVRATGPGFDAEAERFELDAREETLALRGTVRAQGSLAP